MNAGVAQLVERQPSKLNVAGSNPVSRSNLTSVIRLWLHRYVNRNVYGCNNTSRCSSGVERFLGKEEVMGSIPIIGSKLELKFEH